MLRTAWPVEIGNLPSSLCPSPRQSFASFDRSSQHRLGIARTGRVVVAAKSGKNGGRKCRSVGDAKADCTIMSGRAVAPKNAAADDREVWIETSDVNVAKSAIDIGWRTIVTSAENDSSLTEAEMRELQSLGARLLVCEAIRGEVVDLEGTCVAGYVAIQSGEDQSKLAEAMGRYPLVLMDAMTWKVIPAENAVALFQSTSARVFGSAATAEEALLHLQSLEVGLHGVLLRTNCKQQLLTLKESLPSLAHSSSPSVPFLTATVTSVSPAGMGERACVDLCSSLTPGWGLLVGSFCRGFFLVHSECLQSDFVPSRPFRVNAGPVHSYVMLPGGRTAYLSELRSGSTVLAVGSQGESRELTVGRVKIEKRPLTRVEAQVTLADGDATIDASASAPSSSSSSAPTSPPVPVTLSILLQAAETVHLVTPGASPGSPASSVSVQDLRAGQQVMVMVPRDGAQGRHTGILVDEYLLEQ